MSFPAAALMPGDVANRPGLRQVIDRGGHLAGAGERYAGPILLSAEGLASVAAHKSTDRSAVIVGREHDFAGRSPRLAGAHLYAGSNPLILDRGDRPGGPSYQEPVDRCRFHQSDGDGRHRGALYRQRTPPGHRSGASPIRGAN